MNAPTPAVIEGGYRDIIVSLAQAGKIDELERVIRLEEEWMRNREARELRQADREWNDAHAGAAVEIKTVIADTPNPQTRKKYAAYATLDAAIRPFYSKHGFSVSFDTEPGRDVNEILVVGYLAKGSIRRRFTLPVPIETTGIKGGQATTRTWATMSAVTYGRRNLLIMMFNIPIAEADDDGRRAGGQTLKGGDAPQQQQPQEPLQPPIDPKTGELLPPHTLEVAEGEDWLTWARRFMGAIDGTISETQIDEWVEKNKSVLEEMKAKAARMHDRVAAQINKHRNHIKMKDKK